MHFLCVLPLILKTYFHKIEHIYKNAQVLSENLCILSKGALRGSGGLLSFSLMPPAPSRMSAASPVSPASASDRHPARPGLSSLRPSPSSARPGRSPAPSDPLPAHSGRPSDPPPCRRGASRSRGDARPRIHRLRVRSRRRAFWRRGYGDLRRRGRLGRHQTRPLRRNAVRRAWGLGLGQCRCVRSGRLSPCLASCVFALIDGSRGIFFDPALICADAGRPRRPGRGTVGSECFRHDATIGRAYAPRGRMGAA